MTPGARVAAAIAVLDDIQGGAAAEKALTSWARNSRFAGSKDRAAVRDHVFDVLRAKRSLGDGSGRSLMLQLCKREGWDISALFSGEGHAPAALTDAELDALNQPLDLSDAARCDIPEWLWPRWQDSLGAAATPVALAQQGRADVFLRINTKRTTQAQVLASLASEEVAAAPHPEIAGCLRVSHNARRVKTTRAFADGWVELQDAASQFAVRAVTVPQQGRLLDYCAGGGGKALAFADLTDATIYAHDIAPARMGDLPARAARAGIDITLLATDVLIENGPFDVVFCDAPCSGSGTWRRTPDAKWQMDELRLASYMAAQDSVLAAASPLVGSGGLLAYATCSVLADENTGTIARFAATHPDWQVINTYQLLPGPQGDGFFLCLLTRMSESP